VPPQIASNGSSTWHSENRFQSNSEPNRERMHNKGQNSREILSFRLKDRKFLQKIYIGTYRKSKEQATELAKATVRKAVLLPDIVFHVIEDPSVKTVEPEPRMIIVVQGED
jgi:hypothetical protein